MLISQSGSEHGQSDDAGIHMAVCFALVVIGSFGYFAHMTGLFARHEHMLPRVVDACLASASLCFSLCLLTALNSAAFPLYDSKMLSSAVVFFGNARPPSPHAFIVCSAGTFLCGAVLHFLGAPPGANTQIVTLALISLTWKLSGSSFSATVGLAVFLAESDWNGSFQRPLFFLCFPWLAGHTLLYILAVAWAVPRARARIYLLQREWRRSVAGSLSGGARDSRAQSQQLVGGAGRERMRQSFTQLDTSGDGRLDATEFKVALRSLVQLDVPITECEAIIRAIDHDGNGTLDFDAFCQAVQQRAEQPAAPLISVFFAAKLRASSSQKHSAARAWSTAEHEARGKGKAD